MARTAKHAGRKTVSDKRLSALDRALQSQRDRDAQRDAARRAAQKRKDRP